jgi:arginase
MRPFTLIGAPIDSVGRSGGTEHSPQALRDLGLLGVLGDGPDQGDLPIAIRGDDRDPDSGLIAHDSVISSTVAIRNATRDALARGERVFIAGGCCTELVGALAGARDALGGASLAYFDGHLDLYDGETSPTGEAADMPVATALGRGPAAWLEAAGGAAVEPQRTAILGYRDLEESKTYGSLQPEDFGADLLHVSSEGLRGDDAMQVGEQSESRLRERGGKIWLHLDVDVLDEDVFPATDYLAPGGLEWSELIAAMRPIGASDELIGVSIGCYNPEKDPESKCGRALVDALDEILARPR